MSSALNTVANCPEVRQHVAPGYKDLDLSGFLKQPGNVAYGDEQGYILFGYMGAGRYEMHWLLTRSLRGEAALRRGRKALRFMFTSCDACVIQGFTPRDNMPARMMNRALGAVPVGVFTDGQGRACIHYVLERTRWATLSAGSLAG